MALVTAEEFRAAARFGDSEEEVAETNRIHKYAVEAVENHAPGAPDASKSEAIVRLGAYLLDQPTATRGDMYASAGRNSGAWSILLPYRVRRAGTVGERVAAAQEAVGTPGNPVVNVEVEAGAIVVSFADGTSRTEDLPAGSTPGGGGVDRTARDAAAAAQATADSNTAAIADKQDQLMPPSPTEAANGVATAIRGWSAQLVRTAISAVLPADDRLVPAGGATGDLLLRQANGAVWTGFRAAVLSVLPASQGSNIGPLTTVTFTSHATAQRYSATGFSPPSDWQLVAVEDRQAAQVFSGLVLLDLAYMRSTAAADRPAAGGTYPDVDAGLGVYALDASGQLLVATFAASTSHTLIYRRIA